MKDGDHYVEIGAWKGRSAAFMATEILNSGKRVKFGVIDTWGGSSEHSNNIVVVNDTLYDIFINNMKPVIGHFYPIKMNSIDASKLYEDNSLDFILIDASHEYEDVKSDILHWYPKLKHGGMIAGDDYSSSWPGVIKAVNEVLSYKIIIDGVCWTHEKNKI